LEKASLLAAAEDRYWRQKKAERNQRDLVAKILSGNWVAPLDTRGQRRPNQRPKGKNLSGKISIRRRIFDVQTGFSPAAVTKMSKGNRTGANKNKKNATLEQISQNRRATEKRKIFCGSWRTETCAQEVSVPAAQNKKI
jgi:hypothetical protein